MINKNVMTALSRILAIIVVAALVLMGIAVGEVSREGPGIMQRMRRRAAGMRFFPIFQSIKPLSGQFNV